MPRDQWYKWFVKFPYSPKILGPLDLKGHKYNQAFLWKVQSKNMSLLLVFNICLEVTYNKMKFLEM